MDSVRSLSLTGRSTQETSTTTKYTGMEYSTSSTDNHSVGTGPTTEFNSAYDIKKLVLFTYLPRNLDAGE